MLNRREFIGLGIAGAAALATGACADVLGPAEGVRLNVNPDAAPNGQLLPAGLHQLGLATQRDGLLYVPQGYSPLQPPALVLMLHGAGGNAANGILPFQSYADGRRMLLLAPDSRDTTWDALENGGYTFDITYITKALQFVFDRYRVDRSRIFIEGFSDGASYAYALGLSNGNLFSRIVAFSPGFIPPTQRQGKPRVFDSHGTNDTVLPVDSSRSIVNQLRNDGYAVDYREFTGGHTVPTQIASDAVDFLFA